LFGSFAQPITTLLSLSLSIGGAILALLATGRPLNLPVVIGVLMLMRIVTKNAITARSGVNARCSQRYAAGRERR
jgi:multidrug efflux pump subunit AcrB